MPDGQGFLLNSEEYEDESKKSRTSMHSYTRASHLLNNNNAPK